MVTTNDDSLADKVASLRNHGSVGHPGPGSGPAKPYQMGRFQRLGYNLRLSDIQSAVGVAQMGKLEALLEERRRLAAHYDELLNTTADLRCPIQPAGDLHTYQGYVVRVTAGGTSRRNRIMERLAADGIPTRPGTHAVHRLGYYQEKYNIHPDQFPNACITEDTTITLPLFPGMTNDEQQQVVRSLTSALAES